MPRKRHKPEEIVAKLRQVDVLTSQGQSAADAGSFFRRLPGETFKPRASPRLYRACPT